MESDSYIEVESDSYIEVETFNENLKFMALPRYTLQI
jgi:hypothetical protein